MEPCDCPVCLGVRSYREGYFERSFGQNLNAEALAESVADDLGYCERHGKVLSREEQHAASVARVFARAIGRIEPLLHESVLDDRGQRLFFSTGRRCPACSAEEMAAGKLLSPIRQRLRQANDEHDLDDPLCLHHFQALGTRLPLELRGRIYQQRIDTLGEVARRLQRDPGAGAAMALGLIGHDAPVRQGRASLESDGACEIQDLLSAAHVCPICEALGWARRHWLRRLRWSARPENREFIWLFAPSCAEHVADAVAACGEDQQLSIVSYLLPELEEQLRQKLTIVVHDLMLANQPKPVWYRPRRKRGQGSASQTQPATRTVLKCKGCETEAVALERATAHFLDLMRHKYGRDALARGRGLCLKHLAHVQPVAPHGDVRAFLADLHADRLQTLRVGLDASPDMWREAIYRFKGWSL